MSGPLAGLVSGVAGTVLCGIACAVVAGALDAKRRDVAALGAVLAALGLVAAGSGLVAAWVPEARLVLVVAIAGAVATTVASYARARRVRAGHFGVLLAGTIACEVVLAAGAWMAAVVAR